MAAPRRPKRSEQGPSLSDGKQAANRTLYKTNPGPQDAFMLAEEEEILLGGAKGGGKSFALRAWAVRYCMQYPGANVAIFRRTYRELEETHIIELRKELPDAVAHYEPAHHRFRFANGSLLWLRYCEQDEDAKSYESAEFDALLFDEITHFTQYQYTFLTSRCRSTKPWWPGPRMRVSGTPLGRGHAWVKARWIDKHHPYESWTAPVSEGGLTRVFIPAKITDNPILTKAHPTYVTQLQALPYEEYRAAMGDWSVQTGQYFTRWRDELHVVRPFDIPPDWDKWLCVDYGFNAPYAAIWIARPPQTHTYWVYREHYGTGVKHEDQVLRAFDVTDEAGERLKAVILDPSMFARVNVKGERVAPMADDWKASFRNTKVIPGNNERIPGWSLFRKLIDWREGPDGRALIQPRFFVFDSCSNVARTIPLLISDEHNPEDVDSDGEDHAADAIRYAIMHAERGRNTLGNDIRNLRLGPRGLTIAGRRQPAATFRTGREGLLPDSPSPLRERQIRI